MQRSSWLAQFGDDWRPIAAASRILALFGVYSAALCAANATTLVAVWDLSRADATASHLPIVPVAAFALLVPQLPGACRARKAAPWAGIPLLALGLAVTAASRTWCTFPNCAPGLSLSAAGLILLWIGGFVLLFGLAAARLAAFPLLLMMAAVPLPPSAIDTLTQLLKHGSAVAVELLFRLSGTTFHRDAFVFSFPQLSIEIADECSGIRSSIALMLTSLVAGHPFFERWWTKVLLALIVVPVAMLKNAIRIVALTLLSIHVDPGFLAGQLHHEGGSVFFLLALLMLSPALPLLRNMETRARGERSV